MEDKLNELTFAQALIIGIGMAVVYYFMIFQVNDPEFMMSQMKDEISQNEGEIKKFDKRIEQAEILKEKIKVLEKDLSVKFSYVSESLSKSQVLQTLSVEARNAGLGIESIAEEADWSSLTSLQFLEVPTVVTGDFSQIMAFLSSLSKQQKLIMIDKFEISTSQGAFNEEGDVGKPRAVKFSVAIKVYRKIPGSMEFVPNQLQPGDEGYEEDV